MTSLAQGLVGAAWGATKLPTFILYMTPGLSTMKIALLCPPPPSTCRSNRDTRSPQCAQERSPTERHRHITKPRSPRNTDARARGDHARRLEGQTNALAVDPYLHGARAQPPRLVSMSGRERFTTSHPLSIGRIDAASRCRPRRDIALPPQGLLCGDDDGRQLGRTRGRHDNLDACGIVRPNLENRSPRR